MAATTAELRQELADRLLKFAVRILTVVRALPRGVDSRHVARQLLRSGTAPGANYEEACGAESRRDFVHKLRILLKELKETRYWLRLAARAPLLRPASRLDPILAETEELIALFGKSVSTSRRRDLAGDGSPH